MLLQLYLKEFSVGYETVTIQVVHPEKEFQPPILRVPLKSTKIETNNYCPLRFHIFLRKYFVKFKFKIKFNEKIQT